MWKPSPQFLQALTHLKWRGTWCICSHNQETSRCPLSCRHNIDWLNRSCNICLTVLIGDRFSNRANGHWHLTDWFGLSLFFPITECYCQFRDICNNKQHHRLIRSWSLVGTELICQSREVCSIKQHRWLIRSWSLVWTELICQCSFFFVLHHWLIRCFFYA
jgi:hypothetical protein